MNGTTKFKSLGVVDLEGASIGDGQIEVHMPVEEVSKQLKKVLDGCAEDYLKKRKNVNVEDLNYDIRVVLACGSFYRGNGKEVEFSLLVTVWEDNGYAEIYDDIPVSFTEEETKRVKKILWDKLGELLFAM